MSHVKRLNEFLRSIGENPVYWKTVIYNDYLWVMGLWDIKGREFIHEKLVPYELSFEQAEDEVAGDICERIILGSGVNPDWKEGYHLKVTFF